MKMEGTHKPQPPETSYWIGASREELNERVQARKHQQRSATVTELLYDPSMAATLSLKQDHPAWQKAAGK